jgi:hypothetical protein
MSRVWLITGSASGLGRNIAEAVLASGDRLVALAHDLRRPEDLAELYGVQIRVAPLTSQTLSAFRTRGIGLCRPERDWRGLSCKCLAAVILCRHMMSCNYETEPSLREMPYCRMKMLRATY